MYEMKIALTSIRSVEKLVLKNRQYSKRPDNDVKI